MGGKSGRKKKKKAILLAPSSSQFLTSHEPHCWGRRWEGGGTHRAGARKGKMGRARTVSRFWPFFVFCFLFFFWMASHKFDSSLEGDWFC